MPRSIIAYHSVTLVPILIVSAIYGARRVAPMLSKSLSIPVTKWVLLFTVVLSYVLAPLSLPGATNFWKPKEWIHLPDPTIKQICALVGKRAAVSVQANVGAHFSQNQLLHRYPYKVGEADAIVLWLESPTSNIVPHDKQVIGTLAHHLQMKPAEYLASVECLLRGTNYGVVLWKEPWLVLARGMRDAADESIWDRLDKMRYAWSISSKEYETALQECRH